MVVAMVALLLSSGAATAAADMDSPGLPDIFISACLDGQAKLTPGSAEAASFDSLPIELRQGLGIPTSAQVWRLNGANPGYLYILDYAPSGNANPRICGLASDAMDYRSAADAVEMRVTGTVHPRSMQSIQWLNPKEGYDALATNTGQFKVLQVNWLSDTQRAAAMRDLAAIP